MYNVLRAHGRTCGQTNAHILPPRGSLMTRSSPAWPGSMAQADFHRPRPPLGRTELPPRPHVCAPRDGGRRLAGDASEAAALHAADSGRRFWRVPFRRQAAAAGGDGWERGATCEGRSGSVECAHSCLSATLVSALRRLWRLPGYTCGDEPRSYTQVRDHMHVRSVQSSGSQSESVRVMKR